MGHHLTIANTRFQLPGELDINAFDASFKPFLDVDEPFDLECEITCHGADAAISSLPLLEEEPWSFRVQEGRCDVRRRNEAGETIWQIEAPLGFERAAVRWHPALFTRVYRSYEQAWGTGLGLSFLILRLRAPGGLLFHGSASVLDGSGVLCVGVSGRGKSTISGLLDSAGATVLTDEHPVLRQVEPPAGDPDAAAFFIHGSPWPSSAGYAANEGAPLKRIYFLEHGLENRITRLEAKDALARLIHVAVIPWQDPQLFDPCLQTVEALLASVPVAVLSFRPDEEVVEVIRRDMEEKR